MKTSKLNCIITFFLLFLISTANAQDDRKITFTVPVEFKSIHEDNHSLTVDCFVYDAQNQKIGYSSTGISANSLDPQGNYSGNFTINVTADSDKEIMDAVRYKIVLLCDYHITPESGGNIDSIQEPEFNHEHLPARAKNGTELITEQRGDIVWE
ncbi:hypothetical protein HQ585_12295 [candidate division KSB1 bacterium]|nr:hypothetical protein [candidate division KSB1 bacterium]